MKWIVIGAYCILGACAARAELGPAPPRLPLRELARWQEPPPLAPETTTSSSWRYRREVLDSGLGVTVIARPDTKATAITLAVPAASDPGNGAVVLLGEALRAGTRSSTGEVLNNPKLAQSPISVLTDGMGTTFSWLVLSRASATALRLLADFVLHPSFDPIETAIRKQQELTAIQRQSGTNGHLARLARDALPSIHIPTPEDDANEIIQLSPDSLRALHRCVISPAGAELVMVGPLDVDQAIGWARESFSDFKAPKPGQCRTQPQLAPPSRLEQIELKIVRGWDSDPQLVVAVPGPPKTSSDFLPFVLLSELIGGRESGAARRLRHAGATYGIRSRIIVHNPQLSVLELAGQVEADRLAVSLRTVVNDLRDVSRTMTAAELEEVKRRWATSNVQSMSNNSAVADLVFYQLQRGLPPQSAMTFDGEVRSVTLERCKEVAQRWLDGVQPSLAVAGKLPKTTKSFELALGRELRVTELWWQQAWLGGRKAATAPTGDEGSAQP